MVIFHSYGSLPEGTQKWVYPQNHPIYIDYMFHKKNIY
jgi:hypothetical protein